MIVYSSPHPLGPLGRIINASTRVDIKIQLYQIFDFVKGMLSHGIPLICQGSLFLHESPANYVFLYTQACVPFPPNT